MKTILPKTWPDDYRQWTGSFRDLVRVATEVLAQLEPEAKAPTERLLRYYQQEGVLGRGSRQGNSAVFNFADLERVVATKSLVQQNWTLDNAAKLFSTSGQQPEAMTSLLYASPSSLSLGDNPVGMPNGFMSSPALPGNGEGATSVVARLMASNHAMPPPAKPSALPPVRAMAAPALRGSLGPGLSKTLNVAPVQSYRPTPWLTVYLDEAAAQGAAPDERAQARDTLEALLKTLR